MLPKPPSLKKRIFRRITGICVFALLTLIGAELAVRGWVSYLHRAYAQDKPMHDRDYSFLWMPVTSSMNANFWKLFLTERPDPRLLPYVINRYFDLESKIPKTINSIYRLTPGTYPLADFTRKAPQPKFAVNINTQGFRGPEPTLHAANRVRILCLGSYQTFGHGVADAEAYPARLAEDLGRRYAVWNGGMQSVALRNLQRRMKLDLDEISPHVMVLETGFVDTVAMKNDVFFNPGEKFFAVGSRAWRTSQRFFSRVYSSFVGRSYLVSMLSQKAASGGRDANLEDWRSRMATTLDENSRRGIYTILTNPISGGFPAEAYRALLDGRDDATFVDVKALLNAIPEAQAKRYAEDFNSRRNWVSDHEPYLQKLLFRSPLSFYKTNFSHPNPLAHGLIAAELARVIRERPSRLTKPDSGRTPSSRRP